MLMFEFFVYINSLYLTTNHKSKLQKFEATILKFCITCA